MKRFLRQNQRQELLAELSHENNKRYADRIRVILLVDDGETLVDIARFLFLDEGTVRNWRRRYEEGGIEKLLNDHYIGRVALLDEQQLAELSEELASQVYPTTKAVIELVEQRFGVTYTIGGMTSLLHRLGFSYKKPKGVPAKADAESQRPVPKAISWRQGQIAPSILAVKIFVDLSLPGGDELAHYIAE